MTQAEKQHTMATAPIPGLIARLSVPTIISMLITSFYNMADTVVFPLMSIIQALGFLFGHGSGNSVSRKLGAQKVDEAELLLPAAFFLRLSVVCLF